jgi:hypothetical protein
MAGDNNATILAEVQTDLRWIGKAVEKAGETMGEIEERANRKIAEETKAREASQAALTSRIEDCEKHVDTARAQAVEAKDSAKRMLWVGAAVLATATTVSVVVLKLLFDLASQLKVLP